MNDNHLRLSVNVFPMIWFSYNEDNDNKDFQENLNKTMNTLYNLTSTSLYNLFNYYKLNTTDYKMHIDIDQAIHHIDELAYSYIDSLAIAYLSFYGNISKEVYNNASFFFCNPLEYPNNEKSKELEKYGFPTKNQIVQKRNDNLIWANSVDDYAEYHIIYNPTIIKMNAVEEVIGMNRNKIKSLITMFKGEKSYDVLTCGDCFIFDFTREPEE